MNASLKSRYTLDLIFTTAARLLLGVIPKRYSGLGEEVVIKAPNRKLEAQLAVNEANAAVVEATLRRLQDQLARLKGVIDPRAVSAEEVRTVYVGQQVDLFMKSEVPAVTAEVNVSGQREAANAHIGLAKAAFFPVIRITGAAGFASADLGTLLDWPSRIATFGPSISVPVFQGGRNRAKLKAAEARYEQSVALYRGSVLNAFREVEDALSDLATRAAQAEAVSRALISARDTVTLANLRYQQGLSSYLDVVDAQRAALQAERQDTQLRGQRAISTILLAKSVGGGWQHEAGR